MEVKKCSFPERCEPVMKYMGDQPSKQSRVGNELTDEIFEPALKHVRMADYSLHSIYSACACVHVWCSGGPVGSRMGSLQCLVALQPLQDFSCSPHLRLDRLRQ